MKLQTRCFGISPLVVHCITLYPLVINLIFVQQNYQKNSRLVRISFALLSPNLSHK